MPKIIPIYTTVPNQGFTVLDLDLGEIALNVNDGTLYLKKETAGIPSVVILAGSGSSVVSSSYALTSSYASYADVTLNATNSLNTLFGVFSLHSYYSQIARTASYAYKADYSDFALKALTANNASTASLPIRGIITASAANTTITFTKGDGSTFNIEITQTGSVASASYAATASIATSASYAFNAISASYALTASFPLQGVITASAVGSTITFTKGDSSTFNVTITTATSQTASYVSSSNVDGPLGKNSILSASYALTASYILNAVSSSYALSSSQAFSASYALSSSQAVSSSFALSASFAQTASYTPSSLSASYASTSSNIEGGTTNYITLWRTNTTLTSSVIYQSGSNITIGGGTVLPSAKLEVKGAGSTSATAALNIIDASSTDLLYLRNDGFVGIGTASAASTENMFIKKQWSIFNQGADLTNYTIVDISNTTSVLRLGVETNSGGNILSGTTAYAGIVGTTKSFPLQFITNNTVKATLLNNGNFGLGVTSPLYMLDVSGSARITSSVFLPGLINVNQANLVAFDSASGQLYYQSTSSFTAATASYITSSNVFGPFGSNSILSASFAVSSSQAQNAVTASYVLNAVSASFASTASFVQNAISASFAATASSADNFTVRGTLTAQTIVAQIITSSTDFVTGSTRFGTLLTNTHQFTGSVSITGSLNVTGAGITGSLFGTASWANNAITASNALTASFVQNAVSASYALSASNAQTASYVLNAVSASFASTASNVLGGAANYIPLWNGNTILSSSVIYQTGGNIGVGTTSPSYKLDINGQTRIDGKLFNASIYIDNPIYFEIQDYIEASTIPSNVFLTTGGTAPTFTSSISSSQPFGKVAYNTGYYEAIGDYIPVQAGETIYGEIWARRDSGSIGTAGAFYVGIARYDKDKNVVANNIGLDYFVASGVTVPTDGIWTRYSGSSTLALTHTPYNGSDGGPVRYIRPYIIVNYNTGTIPTYWGGLIIRRTNLYRDFGNKVFQNGNVGIGTTFPNAKLDVNGNTIITGSLIVTQGITSSLFGTASWASQALTASYVLNAISASFASTASYVLNAISASFASTASFVQNAISASFASTASLPLRGLITASAAGSTITFTKGDSSTFNITLTTATADTASYVTSSNVDGPFGKNSILSASFAVSASQAQNATTASYILNAVSASFASTASYVLNAVSSSFAATASSADNFTVRGTLTAQTIVTQVITSSTDFVTGSSRFGTLLTNTHQFTGSVLITGSLNVTGAGITGSLFGTSSWANNAISSSFSSTASFVQNAVSSSFATSASQAQNAVTASYITSSNVFGPFGSNSILSASYAVTAAFAANSSNVNGGAANYITMWTSATALSSSTIYQSTGNIGIGTITPNAKFDVNGNTIVTGSLTVFSGSAGKLSIISGSISILPYTSSGMLILDDISWWNNSTNYTYPQIVTRGTDGVVYRTGISLINNTEVHLISNTKGVLAIRTAAGIPRIILSNDTWFQWSSAETNGFTLDTTIRRISAGILQVTSSLIADSFTGSLQGTSSWAISASWAPSTGGVTGGATSYIPLWSSATTLTSSIMYQTSSKIGVGTTTNINADFDVNGTFRIKSVSNKPSNFTLITHTDPDGGITNAGFGIFSTTGSNTTNNPSLNIQGYYGAGVSGDTILLLNPLGGRVAINTGTPTTRSSLSASLHVQGTAYISSSLGVNVAPNATVGRIDASNDIVAFSTSDKRLKENIKPIENAIYKLNNISGVYFNWKPELEYIHGYTGKDVGIIAQELNNILPESVRTNDTGYLAVRYEKIIPLLIEAIKEQQKQIDELKNKINASLTR